MVEWDKMSKSKKNGVDPSLLIHKYGCDTVRLVKSKILTPELRKCYLLTFFPSPKTVPKLNYRMMMLTNVSPQTERNWSEKEYVGMRNLQIKLWKMVSQVQNKQFYLLKGAYWIS